MSGAGTDAPEVADGVVGRVVELTVGDVAHGGHCVARHDGRVVFVRYALPGEQVRARVTSVGGGGRFLRADAIEVMSASPDRVEPPCPHSGPGRCGGCDWQHATPAAQRALKARVLREALRRQGGLAEVAGDPLEDAVEVVAVPGDEGGLRWRTRVTYAVRDGRAGLHRYRSHDLEHVHDCRIATSQVVGTGATGVEWPEGTTEVHVVASSAGDRVVAAVPVPSDRAARGASRQLLGGAAMAGAGGRSWVRERAAGRDWRVAVTGFWQVHPGAAEALVTRVRTLLAPQPGERVLDLYSGVGLFAGALGEDVGPHGSVDAVEADRRAVADARRNLHDLPQVRLHHAPVERWLRGWDERPDLVVLDPPRQGAGATVLRAVLALAPRAVAYVACDPVALARDLRTAHESGWTVAAVQGLDLFPMTHHLEAVALLLPGSASPGGSGRPS